MIQGSTTTLTGRRVLLSPFSPIVLGALCWLFVATFLTNSSSLVLCYDVDPTTEVTGDSETAGTSTAPDVSEDQHDQEREDDQKHKIQADAPPFEAIQKAMQEIGPLWNEGAEANQATYDEEERAERLRKEAVLTDLVKKLDDARVQRNKKIIAGSVAGALGVAALVALMLFVRSRRAKNKSEEMYRVPSGGGPSPWLSTYNPSAATQDPRLSGADGSTMLPSGLPSGTAPPLNEMPSRRESTTSKD